MEFQIAARIRLKRTHGLGNVLQLLPAIEALVEAGVHVDLYTQPEFIPILIMADMDLTSVQFHSSDDSISYDVDLDVYTSTKVPAEHRVLEFSHVLNVEPLRGFVPLKHSGSSQLENGDFIALCPEAGHPARQWSTESFEGLVWELSKTRNVRIVGSASPKHPFQREGVLDLRGTTSLSELVQILSRATTTICMDSGVMHVAASLGRSVVALFGSIDPRVRMLNYEKVCAIVPVPLSEMPNKTLVLESTRPMDRIQPPHVLNALSLLEVNASTFSSAIYCVEGASGLSPLETPDWVI